MSQATIQDTDAERRRRKQGSLVLRVVSSPDQGVLDDQMPVRGAGLVIGRQVEGDKGNPWTIDDPRLSRRHALLGRQSPDHVHVEDLGSSNGTYVNGEKVDRAALGEGDALRLGQTLLVLERLDDRDTQHLSGLGLVGRHPTMARLRRMIRRVAPSDLPVLVMGPTGTGKELVARAVHDASDREGPFVVVNCGAIPETLVESTLFGHTKGAFTGATADQDGAFTRAHGGTLFLDEIGEMSTSAQPKLLRALESGEVTPVGASRGRPVQTRVVAATNQPLRQAIGDGRFRADLYARLAGMVLEPSTLATRRSDVMALFSHFAGEEGPSRPLTVTFAERLVLYAWPHNVRELRQLARRLVVLHPEEARWEAWMLDDQLQAPDTVDAPPPVAEPTPSRVQDRPTREVLTAMLEEAGGNISIVAERVGRTRRQVYRWMEQLEIPPGTGRP